MMSDTQLAMVSDFRDRLTELALALYEEDDAFARFLLEGLVVSYEDAIAKKAKAAAAK